jgi:outer membrane protein TolC
LVARFHDPALDALVDEALRRNLQLGEAREHLQAARERYRSAGTVGLPRFGAKTEDAIDPDASASFFVAGFDASWELNLFGRGTALHRQARALDAGVAEWQQARVSLVAEVVRDWLSLQAGRQQQAVLESELELKQRASAISQTRVRLQLAAPVERDMAEMGVSEVKAALAGATAENEVLEGQLAMLLGRNEPLPDWSRPGTLPVLGMVGLDQVPPTCSVPARTSLLPKRGC